MFTLDDVNSDTDCSDYSDSEYSSEEEEICVPYNTPCNPSADLSFIEDVQLDDDEYIDDLVDDVVDDVVELTSNRDTFVSRTRELKHNDELAIAMEISKQQALGRESMRNYQDLDDDEALELALKLSAEAELEERRELVAQQDLEYQMALEEDRKNETLEKVETKNETPEKVETKNEVPEELGAFYRNAATEFMNSRTLINQCPVTISVVSEGKPNREKITFDMSDSIGLLRKYITEKYGLENFDLNFTSDKAKAVTITDYSTFEELGLSHTLIRAI